MASRIQPIGFRGCRLATSVPTTANGIISSACPTRAEAELMRESRQREARREQQRRNGAEQNRQPRAAHAVLTQTLTCAGWREPPAAAASSLSTVSGSTASRRRAPNAATSRLGVVAGAVEAAVDEPLQAAAERAEQRGGGEGRRGDADRRRERQHARREQHEPGEDADEQAGEQARRRASARSGGRSRRGGSVRIPKPNPTGSAATLRKLANPTARRTGLPLLLIAIASRRPPIENAPPASSHFSCWRYSPGRAPVAENLVADTGRAERDEGESHRRP